MTNRVVVIGAGLAGVATVATLARSGLAVTHVAPSAPPDRRTSALMMPTVDWMVATGLIPAPDALGVPLTQIRIIDATNRLIRAPETLFDATEAGLGAFGWNFANTPLLAAFEAAKAAGPEIRNIAATLAALERSGDHWLLTLSDGSTLEADLVVGADGKKSYVRSAGDFRARENGFEEAALVCDLELSRPLGGASVEFHYPRGPFTLVPAGGTKANLVWIDDREALRALQAQGRDAVLAAIEAKSQHLFGRISLLTPTHMFLLSSLVVPDAGHDGAVLVGEAAHAFPPIGAQGLNLGLRDVEDLGRAIAEVPRDSASWAAEVSRIYADLRRGDLLRTSGMVDTLFRSLLSDFVPAQALRAGGLWTLKLLPFLRKGAFGLGMGAR
jgi:2-octaprenyl-6-methoxyphenol hydroxylase